MLFLDDIVFLTWFKRSAKEWMASDNIEAEPVKKYAISLNTITVALLEKKTYSISSS